MKIELESPFKEKWKFGYLRVTNEGRNCVDLYNTDSDRTTISYARYLMSVKLGYEVPEGLEVDHRDDDKTNDDIDNLQLLTPLQNKIKKDEYYLEHVQVSYGYECAYCGISFILTEREVNMRLAKNVEYAYCSRSCSAKNNVKSNNLFVSSKDSEVIQRIKELSSMGYTAYKIGKELNISANTAMKYIRSFTS